MSPVTVGPNSPSSAVNTDRGASYSSWSSSTNVYSSNDSRASTYVSDTTTDYLDATGFGFSLSDAVILGVFVEIERSEGNTLHNIVDETVRLLSAGIAVGSNKADTGTEWPTTDAYASYGGSSDLWEYGWTPALINASTFGVRIAASGATDGQARIDHIRISVTYSPSVSAAEAASLADTLTMKMGKVLTEAATLSEALALKTGKVTTDALSLTDAVSVVLLRTVSVSDALSILDALSLKTGKALTDSVTLSDTIGTMLINLPMLRTVYAPRPLITLTIAAVTKYYSTETLLVPIVGQVGVAQVGESQVGG